jgi:hypothetical protein
MREWLIVHYENGRVVYTFFVAPTRESAKKRFLKEHPDTVIESIQPMK